MQEKSILEEIKIQQQKKFKAKFVEDALNIVVDFDKRMNMEPMKLPTLIAGDEAKKLIKEATEHLGHSIHTAEYSNYNYVYLDAIHANTIFQIMALLGKFNEL